MAPNATPVIPPADKDDGAARWPVGVGASRYSREVGEKCHLDLALPLADLFTPAHFR